MPSDDALRMPRRQRGRFEGDVENGFVPMSAASFDAHTPTRRTES